MNDGQYYAVAVAICWVTIPTLSILIQVVAEVFYFKEMFRAFWITVGIGSVTMLIALGYLVYFMYHSISIILA